MATATATTGDNDITLRDVVNHMSVMKGELVTKMNDMEQRLSKEIRANTVAIQHLEIKTDGIILRLNGVEKNLTERIDALQEDLFATATDTVHIRKYVGMALPDEE